MIANDVTTRALPDQQGDIFAGMVGPRPGRITTVVGGYSNKIPGAEVFRQPAQKGVKGIECPGKPPGIVAVSI